MLLLIDFDHVYEHFFRKVLMRPDFFTKMVIAIWTERYVEKGTKGIPSQLKIKKYPLCKREMGSFFLCENVLFSVDEDANSPQYDIL